MDVIGKSPIAPPLFLLGKAAMVCCWLFFIVKLLGLDTMLYDSAATRIAGAAAFLAGSGVSIVSLLQLGRSTSMGLPEGETELKTDGLYRLSRNPIYLGIFLMCAGSCLFSLHPVNLFLCATTIVFHLLIVHKEEEFLEKRFGSQWLKYKAEVPRFLGWRRTPRTEVTPSEGRTSSR